MQRLTVASRLARKAVLAPVESGQLRQVEYVKKLQQAERLLAWELSPKQAAKAYDMVRDERKSVKGCDESLEDIVKLAALAVRELFILQIRNTEVLLKIDT